MENRITNTTNLNAKKVLGANFLKNKFITICYVVLTVVFLSLAAYDMFKAGENFMVEVTVHVAFAFISVVFAVIIPLFSSYSWARKAKREFGSSNVQVEYQFTDINLRLLYDGKVIDKYDYRNIYKTIKKKNMFAIIGDRKLFIIDIDGFKKSNDLEKVEAYIKRFTK